MRNNPSGSAFNDRVSRARLVNVTDPAIMGTPNTRNSNFRALGSNPNDSRQDSSSAYRIREAFQFVSSDAHKLE